MLFLAISTPLPTRPSEVREQRKLYWPWAQDKLDRGLARFFFARTGRGAVALFDVDSNETLHTLLTEWAEMIPAEFDVYPLIDPDAAVAFLNKSGNSE